MAALLKGAKQKISHLETLKFGMLTSVALPLVMVMPVNAQVVHQSPPAIVGSECHSDAMAQAIEQLHSSSEAFQRLVTCGDAATSLLIQILDDERQDSLKRRVAARALSQIGSPDAIATLVRAAQQHEDIRDSILRAIADINPAARAAIPVLLTAVENQDLEVSRAAVEALHRLDPALPDQVMRFLGEAVRSSNTQRRDTVRSLLAQLRSNTEPDISLMTQALNSEDEATRSIAAYVLAQRGREAQAAIPTLTETLDDPSQPVRDTAAYALGRIGSREAIAALLVGLRSGNEAMHTSAAVGLIALNADARESVPLLIAALRDPDELVRSVVAYALGHVGTDARRATPALIGGLSDRSAAVREAAADALGQVNPNNSSAIWALVRRVTTDPDSTVRDSAAYALKQITPDAIPTLLEVFASPNAQEAEFAAYLLLEFGTAVNASLTLEQIPLILTGVSHGEDGFFLLDKPYRTEFADYVFKQLGSDVFPILIASLQGQNEDIQVGAIRSLYISSKYFDRQFTETAVPNLRRIFRSSRLYTLWQSENQELVTAALGQDELTDSQASETAFEEVQEIVYGDRVGFASFLTLIATQEGFWDELELENATALHLIRSLILEILTGNSGELSAAARTYQASNRPAVCRLPVARFLWRCR